MVEINSDIKLLELILSGGNTVLYASFCSQFSDEQESPIEEIINVAPWLLLSDVKFNGAVISINDDDDSYNLVWESGTWCSGTWWFGEWRNGIWLDGIWMGGIWLDGRWFDGIWDTGIWSGGVWESGLWKNGDWYGGVWNAGSWEKGMINNDFSNVHP